MKFNRIYAIFIRQIFLFRRNPVRLFNIFLWISIDIVLWGFITKYFDTLGNLTFSFANVLLGAIILWGFHTRVQQGLMTSFLEDVWSQNFLNFFASPLTIKEYVNGLVLTSILTSLAGFIIMILFAGLGFGFNIFKIGSMLLPFMFILFIFGVALGIFAIAIILRFGPSAEWITWTIPFTLSPFIGIFYPISILPASLQIISKLIPASYVFESMRKIVITETFSSDMLTSLFIGTALAFFYLFLMYSLFLFIYRSVLKSGSLSRFSAEGS